MQADRVEVLRPFCYFDTGFKFFSRVVGYFLALLLDCILLFIGFADRLLGRIFFNLPNSVSWGIIENKLKELSAMWPLGATVGFNQRAVLFLFISDKFSSFITE